MQTQFEPYNCQANSNISQPQGPKWWARAAWGQKGGEPCEYGVRKPGAARRARKHVLCTDALLNSTGALLGY